MTVMWSKLIHCHADGEWVKVDETHVGLKGSKSFFETRDFLIDPAAPSSLAVQLSIKIPGKYKKNYSGLWDFYVVIHAVVWQ